MTYGTRTPHPVPTTLGRSPASPNVDASMVRTAASPRTTFTSTWICGSPSPKCLSLPMSTAAPGIGGGRIVRPGIRERQFTFTALQAAATALYSALPAPYRSFAAFSVAVRAPA